RQAQHLAHGHQPEQREQEREDVAGRHRAAVVPAIAAPVLHPSVPKDIFQSPPAGPSRSAPCSPDQWPRHRPAESAPAGDTSSPARRCRPMPLTFGSAPRPLALRRACAYARLAALLGLVLASTGCFISVGNGDVAVDERELAGFDLVANATSLD